MNNEDKKVLFGLSFPAIMVAVFVGIILTSGSKK